MHSIKLRPTHFENGHFTHPPKNIHTQQIKTIRYYSFTIHFHPLLRGGGFLTIEFNLFLFDQWKQINKQRNK